MISLTNTGKGIVLIRSFVFATQIRRYLFPIFFLEVDARKDTNRGDAEEENGKGWQVGGVHLSYSKKKVDNRSTC